MADAPKVGQVIEHHFLWFEEQTAGVIEGRKSRPCLIIAVEKIPPMSSPRVTVLPITSQAPRNATAVAVPSQLHARLGLDPSRPAWVIIDDANVFAWPGFDLVPQPDGGFVRGIASASFFEHIRRAVIAVRSSGKPRTVKRDEG
jgi:hypothetical protein